MILINEVVRDDLIESIDFDCSTCVSSPCEACPIGYIWETIK